MLVAVVGTCASGKTSVVACLQARGIDAYAVAQEHSIVAELWRHRDPDRLVYLETSLATIRRRRSDDSWPEWIYETQLQRLAHARKHADVTVGTDALDLHAVVDAVSAALSGENSPAAGTSVASPAARDESNRRWRGTRSSSR
jgi:hypothetical protein